MRPTRLLVLVCACCFLASGCVRIVRGESGHVHADGIYSHDEAAKGRELGLSCPSGFSYKIQYDNFVAAAIGDEHFTDVEDMSKIEVQEKKEQYVAAILRGFSQAIAKTPPIWVKGQAVGAVTPNYYPGGDADAIDLTLKKEAFPYDATSPAGKELHDSLLKKIEDRWKNITEE